MDNAETNGKNRHVVSDGGADDDKVRDAFVLRNYVPKTNCREIDERKIKTLQEVQFVVINVSASAETFEWIERKMIKLNAIIFNGFDGLIFTVTRYSTLLVLQVRCRHKAFIKYV